ncbi:conserved hypothetical protein [Theileria equi strain WA]|uniref:Tetratricopeptide SHNi-TPR domain-containing protein n=1 Tax=Theileria equi strain WA TaxID=1537102 RepID=L1LBR3_THEEQ|nr:conserved hypothetical protein [Theileria equi strain WA]EKX72751.1 conserved hypothetical protein [Theileria equi strain WA]|eukprot:XP_004832203.1 conserved hypothetical protein [Theileria equi strain WA]
MSDAEKEGEIPETEKEEEIDYDAFSPEELFEKGKFLFKERKYEESAEYFSRALERRSGDEPIDPSLRENYLWFADALLTKEEQSAAIFSSDVNGGGNENIPTAESVITAANNDESLAFELFQLGYESYKKHFETLKENVPKEEVLDCSYCLVRIGDMYFTNHQFEESAKEYQNAIKLREEHKLPVKHLGSLYISLSQSLMFNGQLKESLENFKKCRDLLQDLAKESEGEEEKKNVENTLEDVSIQIEDLEKLIEANKNNQGATKGSQSNAASLVPKTTGNLDEKQLDSTQVKSVTIDIGGGSSSGKKRRIDLTKVYE